VHWAARVVEGRVPVSVDFRAEWAPSYGEHMKMLAFALSRQQQNIA